MLKAKQPPLLGWFGKLPVLGDFAGKSLPLSLCNQIHAWCAQGMEHLRQNQSDSWEAAYQLSPVWRFVMNAHIWDSRPLMGCVAPSMDKIGRYSPLLVVRSLERDTAEAPHYWLHRTEALLREVVRGELAIEAIQDELEAALAAEHAQSASHSSTGIGISLDNTKAAPFSWRNFPARFSEGKKRSFWWVERTAQVPSQHIVHNGAPDENLFALLMTGWVNASRQIAKESNETG